MNRIALPVVAVILATAACAPMAPVGSAPPPSTVDGACNAEAATWAIGRGVDQEVINRVLHDTGSRDARVIKPGMAVTMDFRADRVNIDVNERGAVTGIRCG